ncbi:carbonic anhydrase [Allocatelliglobosispora scoriae]|uniref:carbonic anhydrase n=1 Tax=Allocatelliglobosispora scoriae TaxID=643052 RepID=A0A841BM74_9ACTN|nr:bifunctional SulP family inorganic anion transporter/carbonic anhydrase [Allocatelliglobosispora scoriae]MBB5868458.1 carbonic anhydrase [Allocatelliglobosispora scoriae]
MNPRPGPVWRSDLPASLVVVLVAVPLSLGIALASGAPPAAGLIAAVVGGIVAGALGGSAVQVSGPAAGLTVIVATTIATFGWRATCVIVAVAGVMQVVLGIARVAPVAMMVSPAVVHGMLAGVGVVIVLAQLHVLLGGAPQASALDNIRELPAKVLEHHSHAFYVGVLTLAVLCFWRRVPRVGTVLPAPLVAVCLATLVTVAVDWDVRYVSLSGSLFSFGLPELPGDVIGAGLAALSIALIASVETLMCAVAVDRSHSGPRANLHRELVGQGTANIVSGLAGGLPVAGVIVRSTTNVAAGARTHWSTIFHGCWILVLVSVASPVMELIPLPALAALLVYTGIRMIDIAHARQVRKHRETAIYVATAAGVVVLGLLEGVAIGIAGAILLALWRVTRIRITVESHAEQEQVTVSGLLTFLAVPTLTRTLRRIPDQATVQIDLSNLYMDHAAASALHDWQLAHERTGGTVEIHEIHHSWYHDAIHGREMPESVSQPVPWGVRRIPFLGTREQLKRGAQSFHRHTRDHVAPMLADLADAGQKPGHLFVTCADSRLVPNLFTSTVPGDLFTVRNIGNVVARHGRPAADPSMQAALDYALGVLEVTTITICGHSHCGAVAAAHGGGAHTITLHRWLDHIRRPGRANTGTTCTKTSAQHNVIQQLDNLRTHPVVARREGQGSLHLVGMYFDLDTSEVHMLDPATGAFQPVTPSEAGQPRPG